MELEANCKAKNSNDQPCGAPALRGSDFCFFHSPEMADERQRASSAGGAKNGLKSLPPTNYRNSINDAGDILKLIAETIHEKRVEGEQSHLSKFDLNLAGEILTSFLPS